MKYGLIAGNGRFPILALEEARKALSFADSPTVIAEARVLAEQLGS